MTVTNHFANFTIARFYTQFCKRSYSSRQTHGTGSYPFRVFLLGVFNFVEAIFARTAILYVCRKLYPAPKVIHFGIKNQLIYNKHMF